MFVTPKEAFGLVFGCFFFLQIIVSQSSGDSDLRLVGVEVISCDTQGNQ